ncbi:MAG: adenylate/guanylate cyclase domain-containing protein [Syntrophothermus sp.]|nr:adenylate/guanylate cyclase domain-containing protein [Ignavibacteriaceae bacterium]
MEQKNKILIAEDELITALDIKKTLTKLNYEVVGVVTNGLDAKKKSLELKPDLILMDINLSGEITGIETAQLILSELNIPVIYLTGLSDDSTLEKAKITEPFGYILKPFDPRNLQTNVEMALYKHSVETELKKRTIELEEEKIKTDVLLQNILPLEIVNELKEKGSAAPREFENVSIMFTDFYNFHDISIANSAERLVEELNDIFYNFDVIIENHGLEKLKTFSDSYLVGAGLPIESEDHAIKIIEAAINMHHYIRERNLNKEIKWKLKIGVNSGKVIAGIVGTNKFTYDIWGDAVNIASRMENNCEPGKINISGSTYKLINKLFECEYRGKLNAKGKGAIDMYYVKRRIKIYS